MTFLEAIVSSPPVVLVVFLVLYLAIWREVTTEPSPRGETPLLRRRFGLFGVLLVAFWAIAVARLVVVFS